MCVCACRDGMHVANVIMWLNVHCNVRAYEIVELDTAVKKSQCTLHSNRPHQDKEISVVSKERYAVEKITV